VANTSSTPPAGIKAAFEEYRAVVERTGERQALWNSSTKDLIFRTLSSLSAELEPMRAVNEGSGRNYDTVCFGFGPTPTHIVLREGAGVQGFVKTGGALFYSQTFNGKVLVGICYPYVKELEDPKPNKGVAVLDPEEITEERVFEHVEQFLRELTEDEESPSIEEELRRRGPLGFRHPKDG
jgi:hypothetical protein